MAGTLADRRTGCPLAAPRVDPRTPTVGSGGIQVAPRRPKTFLDRARSPNVSRVVTKPGAAVAVEVKNLQSGEIFEVGPDGATFGREGGPATIRVGDPSVSKRHARIFQDDNGWFIEDMGSVNGTIIDGGKIAGPLGLRPGLVFQMSKQRFEVVTVDGRGAGRAPAPQPQASGTEQETRTALRQGGGNPLPSELRKDPIPKKKDKAPVQPPRALDEDPLPPEPSIPSNPRTNVQTRNKAPSQLASDGDLPSDPYADVGPDLPPPSSSDPDGYEDVGVGGAFFTGIGYLLKTAPSLVVNPLGTTRNNIETAPLPAVEKLPLAALLAPTLAATTAVQMLGGAVVGFISGAGSVVAVVVGIVAGAIGGGVGALLSGFLGHPILSFLVTKLGGGADARSRTTHLALGSVAFTVLVAAMTLGTIVAALTARLASVSPTFHLIVVVPALLGVVAYPLPVLVQWAWFKAYGVAKWFQTLLLVFAVLGVVGGLVDAGRVLWAGIQAMRATAQSTTVPTPDPTAVPTPDPATPPTPATGPDVATNPPPPPDTVATDVPTPTPTPTTPTPPTPTPTPTIPTPTQTPTTTTTTTNRASSGYAEYARRRARIEAALEADPTLLNNPAVAEKYRRLSKQTYEAEKAAEEAGYVVEGRRRSRDPGLDAFVQKLKRAKAFEATGKTVDALYSALGEP
jgi:pSer/pThr/pTyr-binding forkhead associated (FHA) protein